MESEQLIVWKNDKPVGDLYYENYAYRFVYREDALPSDAVSLTMPVQDKTYEAQFLFPAFQQQLPEGALLEAILNSFGKLVDLTDDFKILSFVGRHKNFYLQFTQGADTPLDISQTDESFLESHTRESLALFEYYMKKYQLVSGLAGVQPKLNFNKKSSKSALPFQSVIVKFHDERQYYGLAINEHFLMRCADQSGILTAKTRLSEDAKLLVVDRFDLKKEGSFIHTEDFCSLLNLGRQGKYNGTIEQVIDQINRLVRPAKRQDSLVRLFKSIVFSNRVFNGDAHLKNFSLQLLDNGDVMLSPAYDIVSTMPYTPGDLPALKFKEVKAWLSEDDLLELASMTGVSRKLFFEFTEKMENAIKQMMLDLDSFTSQHGFEEFYEQMKQIIVDKKISRESQTRPSVFSPLS